MPTIRVGTPSIGMTRPTTVSSPPNAARQTSLEMIADVLGAGQRVGAREQAAAQRRTPSTGISSERDDRGVDAARLIRRAEVDRAGR